MNTQHPSGENFLILGAPGSGKTTLASILAASLINGNHFIDMSRVCKTAGAFDSNFAEMFASFSSKGELVPTAQMMPQFGIFMRSYATTDFFVWSGIFRESEQVKYCYEQIPHFAKSRTPLRVLEIDLSLKEALRRQKLRAELAVKLGQEPRKSDLDPKIAEMRIGIYQKEKEAVLEALSRYHGDFKKATIESQITVQETLALAINALEIREAIHFAFPEPSVPTAD